MGSTVIVLLPKTVSFGDAVFLAGAAGRLNAVTTTFNWNDRFNVWSGLFGGTFLFLSYFGCDQSQVQRYLRGASLRESRLGLMFNAVFKIPMQLFILLLGAFIVIGHNVFHIVPNEVPILFVLGMSSYEVPRLIGRPARIDVFTTEIQSATQNAPPEFGTASALGIPRAHKRVPSSGSTAISTFGGVPSPICSPL